MREWKWVILFLLGVIEILAVGGAGVWLGQKVICAEMEARIEEVSLGILDLPVIGGKAIKKAIVETVLPPSCSG